MMMTVEIWSFHASMDGEEMVTSKVVKTAGFKRPVNL